MSTPGVNYIMTDIYTYKMTYSEETHGKKRSGGSKRKELCPDIEPKR